MKILIFARAPRRGSVRRALDSLLGADGALNVHLEVGLLRQA